MGNTRSSHFEEENDDLWWPKNAAKCEINVESATCSQNSSKFSSDSVVVETTARKELSQENKEKLDEFKLELARKHEKRRQIIIEKRQEMDELRQEVARLKKENETLKQSKCPEESIYEIERVRKENGELREILSEKSRLLESSEELIYKNRELRISIADMQKELQELNTEVLNFEKERQEYNAHVKALKDVISVSKNMLEIRESQLKELKQKVETIEQSLAEREMNILSQDLRSEYERQLANIRSLRTLYQERSRIEKIEREQLNSQLEDYKKEVEVEKLKNREYEERISSLETDNSKKYDEIKVLESNLGLAKAESRQYQAELTVINQLFSQILLGFNNSQNIDLDKLREHLEEHHDLLKNIVVNEISSEVSYALPKVLLDLLNEVNTNVKEDEELVINNIEELESVQEEAVSQAFTSNNRMNSVEEIVENLPKVWKVLIELLSHQMAPVNDLTHDDEDGNPCYKTVETPKGPSLVLSVSQTYIRLKDLILEKKSLEKETNHLKQLNGHLENRLQDQEKRLEQVHSELSKTWHVVGKLQKQHQLLHTQEKILRYELAQKRKLLTELKEELEYSREKWAQAREKDSTTEQQLRQLRTEFASRKKSVFNEDINNSVESGYSDDRECSSDEEPGYETDVSECAQKNSEEDIDISESKDVEIVDVNFIETESKNIVEQKELHATNELGPLLGQAVAAPLDHEEVPSGSGINKVYHSNLEQVKTELVQNENMHNHETSDLDIPNNANNSKLEETEGSPSERPYTSQIKDVKQTRSLEEVLARRDERLRRLEGQAGQLVTQVTNTANRSVAISNRLDNIHEVYGNTGEQDMDNHQIEDTYDDKGSTSNSR